VKDYYEKRTCPKCGSLDVDTKYDLIRGSLLHTCERCDYFWHEKPLDEKED